jgi:glycosyltransferase involved in cell wall biosynthesis
VRQAITSVLNQTFRDFEIIIIDDASNDDTLAVARRAVVECNSSIRFGVRIVARRRNQGYGAATNTALAMARGQWVTFVDGDDWVEPNMLESVLNAALNSTSQITVSGMRIVPAAPKRAKVRREWVPDTLTATGSECLEHLVRGEIGSFQTNKLVAKHLWKGVLSPLDNAYSDVAIMPELFRRAERVAFVTTPLYNYRLRRGSVTGSLHMTAWDLTKLDQYLHPVLAETFAMPKAQELQRHFVYRQVYWPLINGAASLGRRSPLAEELHTWARSRIRWPDLLWFLGQRRVALAAALGLAKTSPALHQRALAAYKGLMS